MENQTVAQKLEALVKLQSIDSKLDQLKKLRGDLPDEVQDLEDEMEGYKTRLGRFEEDQKEIEEAIKKNNIRKNIMSLSEWVLTSECTLLFLLRFIEDDYLFSCNKSINSKLLLSILKTTLSNNKFR